MLNLAGYFLRDTQNVTGKDWNRLIKELMALRNYQLLDFTITQQGTAAPIINEWRVNDLEKQGDSITFQYSDVGQFLLNSAKGLFKTGKTFIEFTGLDFSVQVGITAAYNSVTPESIMIQSSDPSGFLINDILILTNVKVYILD